jgi:hypothetical protein
MTIRGLPNLVTKVAWLVLDIRDEVVYKFIIVPR